MVEVGSELLAIKAEAARLRIPVERLVNRLAVAVLPGLLAQVEHVRIARELAVDDLTQAAPASPVPGAAPPDLPTDTTR